MMHGTSEAAAEIDVWLAEYRGHAEPVGVRVERVGNSLDAAALIQRIAVEAAADDALVSSEVFAAAPALAAEIERLGLPLRAPTSPADARDQRLGLSLARRAIAETGSVLLAEPTLADRATAMLTRINVTLCRTSDLAPSLVEAAAVLKAVAMQPGGSYATLMTGPSRTADIEMSLTVGVQGPASVITIFVDNLT